MGWTAGDLPDLTGRSAVVTGGNSGIGFQTARALVQHGARVVLACRDLERGARAARRIRGQVEVAELDLARIASIRSFVDAWDGPLDLLVNNAGVMAPPRPSTTADGFEMQFGTNHLGHFVLTGLLLPVLLESPAARVVTISSIAHFGGGPDVLDGNAGGAYDPQHAYANSKLANLLFAQELQRRANEQRVGLISTAAHPGIAATNLFTSRHGMGANAVLRVVAPPFVKVFTQSATAGARPTLYAATVATPGGYTGPQRLGETRGRIGPAKLSPLAQDEALARRLWGLCEELTGLRYPWPQSVRRAGQ